MVTHTATNSKITQTSLKTLFSQGMGIEEIERLVQEIRSNEIRFEIVGRNPKTNGLLVHDKQNVEDYYGIFQKTDNMTATIFPLAEPLFDATNTAEIVVKVIDRGSNAALEFPISKYHILNWIEANNIEPDYTDEHYNLIFDISPALAQKYIGTQFLPKYVLIPKTDTQQKQGAAAASSSTHITPQKRLLGTPTQLRRPDADKERAASFESPTTRRKLFQPSP